MCPANLFMDCYLFGYKLRNYVKLYSFERNNLFIICTQFNFINPGTYSIKLTTTNSCGPVTSLAQTVIVKQPPIVSIAAITNSCGTANINPIATVPVCVSSSSTLNYAWSFPGGTPATSTLPYL